MCVCVCVCVCVHITVFSLKLVSYDLFKGPTHATITTKTQATNPQCRVSIADLFTFWDTSLHTHTHIHTHYKDTSLQTHTHITGTLLYTHTHTYTHTHYSLQFILTLRPLVAAILQNYLHCIVWSIRLFQNMWACSCLMRIVTNTE